MSYHPNIILLRYASIGPEIEGINAESRHSITNCLLGHVCVLPERSIKSENSWLSCRRFLIKECPNRLSNCFD